jgi:hypothetical protein
MGTILPSPLGPATGTGNPQQVTVAGHEIISLVIICHSKVDLTALNQRRTTFQRPAKIPTPESASFSGG